MQKIFNIPSGYSFLRSLARAVLTQSLPNLQQVKPNGLSDVLILLPTQRACRDFRKILYDENGKKPLIMPEIRAFGALEDDWVSVGDEQSQTPEIFSIKQAISPLDRQLILAKYIAKLSGVDKRLNLKNPAMALHMAKDLCKLFDSVLIEEADASKFSELVDAEFAENWQLISKFLDIVFKTWPDVLNAYGKSDEIVRRQKLMALELEYFVQQEAKNQARPIIVAGSTGSVMATKKFLKGIIGLANGTVILPGLDVFMDNLSWAAVSLAHPQNNLKNLLEYIEIERENVAILPNISRQADVGLSLKRQLASEMVRPSATSHMWHKLPDNFNKIKLTKALEQVELLEAPTVQIEAVAIALMMRKAVEDKQKCALITPNRQLARRVQNELKRWNIHVDDSSGVPLSDTAPSVFLQHVIAVQLQQFSPSSLLGLLKHPYFKTEFLTGMSAANMQQAIYAIELIILRGVRPKEGIDGLLAALELKLNNKTYEYQHALLKKLDENSWNLAKTLLEELQQVFTPLNIKTANNFANIFTTHLKVAEKLCLIDSANNSLLWQSHEGDSLAQLSTEILQSADNFEHVTLGEYEAMLKNLMSPITVRSKDNSYEGLAIFGALEARLADLDMAIIGGLNEGVWPQVPQTDAWVSRAMMAKIGLPAPERRVGLSAHDFIAAFGVKKIILTRAQKQGGAPSVASRWLLRLKAVLNALDMEYALEPTQPWLKWAQDIDQPSQIKPNPKPEPRPPIYARPKQMSVSDIETWIRDPYAIYAKKILKIAPLDSLELEIGAAEKGSLLHDILHTFSQNYEGIIKPDAKQVLIEIGVKKFSDIKISYPQLYAFWWVKFINITDWFLENETARRANNPKIYSEIKGKILIFDKMGEPAFTLTARADRIDIWSDKAEIIDYKTGTPPSKKQVEAGFSPQLPLEALLLVNNGFDGCKIANSIAIDFSYMQLKGTNPVGKIYDFAKSDKAQIMEDVYKGLEQRIADFAEQNTAYKPRELAEFAARFRDYDHLARTKEWSLIEKGDDI